MTRQALSKGEGRRTDPEQSMSWPPKAGRRVAVGWARHSGSREGSPWKVKNRGILVVAGYEKQFWWEVTAFTVIWIFNLLEENYMAMAAMNSSYLAISHMWTKRQLERGVWIGNYRRYSVAAVEYLGPCWGCSLRFVVFGKAGGRSSCSCGGIARVSGAVQFRGSTRWESDRRWKSVRCNGWSKSSEDKDWDNAKRREDEDVDEALNLDGQIPTTSDGFLKQVSSHAYDLRRQLEQNIESSSYHVLEANPWRETPKPVYVLAQEENRLLTMRTRRTRSEVERELGILFPKWGSRRGKQGRPSSKMREDESDAGFRMLVEDIQECVLVFEDEEEATRYCSLLEGQGKNCAGVAELDASDIFAVCQKTQRLAVIFRRGATPPQPERLQQNLTARKRSLED